MRYEEEKPKFYFVDKEYIEYLLQVDNKVMHNKQGRPYVGVALRVDAYCYFIPLTSLNGKKTAGKEIPPNSLTFRALDGGERGGVNIGNMIPVPEKCLHYYDFEQSLSKDALETEYKLLLKEWPKIVRSANKLYALRSKNLKKLSSAERRLSVRCCNYKLLEQKCKEYEETILCQSSEPAIVENSLLCVQNNLSFLE